MKEKALEYTKALGVTEFKASDCWLSKKEEEVNCNISINI